MTAADRSADELRVCHLGTVPYARAVAIQERIRERRQAGELPDTLLLLEHPPVYTRGRRSDAGGLPLRADFYRERGIEIADSDRGGRVTYHGPGQLVGYPIMALADVGRFVRTMEAAIVQALAQEGVRAHARPQDGPDYTGVWVGEHKIASIGVHVQRGVSTHGFAVNVNNDLLPFDWIVACGLPDVRMTSLAHERPLPTAQPPTGAPRGARSREECAAELLCFRRRVAFTFCQAHGRRQRLVSPARLGIEPAHAAGLASERAPLSTTAPAAREAVPA